jgi:hypothetical protein
MDREAAVIRSAMSQTRGELDRKITQLEARARELTPRRYAERHLPDYLLERVIGGVLTLIGLRMAWSMYTHRRRRRDDVRRTVVSYGRW